MHIYTLLDHNMVNDKRAERRRGQFDCLHRKSCFTIVMDTTYTHRTKYKMHFDHLRKQNHTDPFGAVRIKIN